jgi:hypothetical protein
MGQRGKAIETKSEPNFANSKVPGVSAGRSKPLPLREPKAALVALLNTVPRRSHTQSEGSAAC